MAQLNQSGPGVGLPPPNNLYPSELNNTAYDPGTNKITLGPGDALVIPAGEYFCTLGTVLVLQYLDPVSGVWLGFESQRGAGQIVKSDGYTRRIFNPTGCPVAASVTGGGSGYVQASTTITASAGGSTWQPIVGGQLSVVTVSSAGASYGLQPLVQIPHPPSPGVPATAYASISSGTVTGVTLSNVGGGYTSPQTVTILPSPFDPNINSGITNATVVLGLNAATATAITAALCTNNGASVTSAPSLTVSGTGGSGATVSAVLLQTLTGISIAAGGFGYGASTELQTVGGTVAAGAYTAPAIELVGYRPRKASVGLTVTGGSVTAIGTIYDSGLFAVGTAPTAVIVTEGSPTSTAVSISLVLGAIQDTATIQPI